jgi:general secretion pathway protein D
MTKRLGILLALAVALASGCATGRAFVRGNDAAKAGDWDSAVSYYREALKNSPNRVDVRVALQRAVQTASSAHMLRASQLESQNQLPGALAEYRLASDVDPGNVMAAAKAAELDRRIRQQIEDSRPKSPMDTMREQARRLSPLPQLAVDPRMPLPLLTFNQTQVRQVIENIATFAGINVTYDSASQPEGQLTKAYTVTLSGSTLSDALNQVLSANQLFYKVIDPHTILIASDQPANRLRLEDQVVQTFYLSHADAAETAANLMALLNQVNGLAIRPVIQQNKAANSLIARASIPVMQVIERMVRSMDKPRAEIVIDVEILEVSRAQSQSYGLNLSNYQIGFTASPEAAPPNTSSSGSFPAPPPPFNLNTISNGVSLADFYLSVPTATIKALETDSRTKVLARPSLRGTEGKGVTLNLGEEIPVPTTTFAPIAAGGAATTPTTSFSPKQVGINVSMTPTVTYDNEIRIDVTVENSSRLANVSVGGNDLPSFSTRKVQTTLRLRDGESNLLAGLIKEQDIKDLKGLPGITKVPWLRAIFGATEKSSSSSDIVMIITPHIVRGHELSTDDLSPIYVGTNSNFGLTGAPPLIAAPPTTEELAARVAAGGGQPTTNPVQGAQNPPAAGTAGTAGQTGQTTAPPPTVNRNPNIVPVTPVGGANQPANPPATTPATPPPGARPAQLTVTPPGEMQVGGGPYTLPIQIADANQLGTITLTISYNPAVLKARTVTEGAFMRQGGIATTFTPKIDEGAGRVEITIARPAGTPGISGTGLIGSLLFDAVSAGQANMAITGTATTATGQIMSMQIVPPQIIVR